jgi:riboflavin kinase / FMN adenylyltransferase
MRTLKIVQQESALMYFYHVGEQPKALSQSVITIGNFDGVHRGHQLLMQRTLAYAENHPQVQPVCVSFSPLPSQYFALTPQPRLQSTAEKITLLRSMGMAVLYVLRFNHALVNLSADVFIERIVHRALQAKHVVVGEDFRFGAKREGTVETLMQAGAHWGFSVEVVRDLSYQDRRISSTWVRHALREADFRTAAALLGRDYSITARVVHGQKLGRRLGFPTANLPLDRRLSLLHGVYVVRVLGLPEGRIAYGAASIGTRPAVQGKQIMLEVHLLDFDQDIYGHRIEVAFLHKLRDEWDFPSLDALTLQIADDVQATRAWLACTLGEGEA